MKLINPHRIIFFSGGASSALTAIRVVERYGPSRVVLLFADTKIEDEDLYRFNKDVADYLGIGLKVLGDGRTPWEVFFDERYLGNSRIDPCSKILKRNLLNRWVADNYQGQAAILYIGLKWDEQHRIKRFRERMAPWMIESPLAEWEPYLTGDGVNSNLASRGLEIPRLYKLGFAHNNCGGFCIKAGQSQFKQLLKHFPERYKEHEENEEKFRREIADRTILRRMKDGVYYPLSLQDLRKEIECSPSTIPDDEWGGCGCAIE